VFRTNSIVLQLFYSYHEPRTTALTAAVKRRLQPSSTLGQAPGRGPRAAGQRVCLAGGVSAAGHGFRVPSFRGGMAGRGGGRPGACAPCGADLKRNGTTTAGRTWSRCTGCGASLVKARTDLTRGAVFSTFLARLLVPWTRPAAVPRRRVRSAVLTRGVGASNLKSSWRARCTTRFNSTGS